MFTPIAQLLGQATQALLPYVQIPQYHVGPLTLGAFGPLVVLGIYLGNRMAEARAKTVGLNLNHFSEHIFWTVASGIVLSHVFDQIFYFPQEVLERPWELLFFWKSLSSFGGMFGASVGFFWYGRKHKIDLWKTADCIAYGLPLGFFFGRLGCAAVHDHPGTPSTHFLAVDWPGGPRFDLGLLEAMLLPLLIGLMVYLNKKIQRPGALISILCMAYPFIRFPLDFLRETPEGNGDIRYFDLTPGHYSSIALLVLGIILWNRSGARTSRS